MTIEQTLKLLVDALEKAQEALADDGNYPKTAAALDAPIEAGRAALAQMAAPVAAAPDECLVKKHDANNYCLILRELGMEDEGDPVEEVRRLVTVAAAPDMVLVPREPTEAMVNAGRLGWAFGIPHAWREMLAAAPAAQAAKPEPEPEPAQRLTDAQIKDGWQATFSTNNPFCPCDLKTFTKAARWAESAVRAQIKEQP